MSERGRHSKWLLEALERRQAQSDRDEAAQAREKDRLAARVEALADGLPDGAGEADATVCFPGFDGFVAGVALCPTPIPAAEWLAAAWAAEPELDRIMAGDTVARLEVRKGLAERLEQVTGQLAEDPAGYVPAFGIDADTGEAVWEPWVLGFERAMRLRRDAWAAVALVEASDAAAAVSMMLSLYGVAADIGELSRGLEEPALDLAPELIAVAVLILSAERGYRTLDTGGWTAPWPDNGTARRH